MSNKTPLIENGVVVGTGSDKYETKNPLARRLLAQFDQSVGQLAAQVNPRHILEVGCGEGHVTEVLLNYTGATIHATDLSPTIIDIARRRVASERVTFAARDICDLQPPSASGEPEADLAVCCEVLEHLPDPARGLEQLARLARPYAVLSVPREPLWRVLNFLRGAHWQAWGNSPGHIQHWSQSRFLAFVRSEFEILSVRAPLPWTVVLGRSRRA
ncbi:MAG: hypothetical protein Kow0060_09670 [Methylohalobius crimeensis]